MPCESVAQLIADSFTQLHPRDELERSWIQINQLVRVVERLRAKTSRIRQAIAERTTMSIRLKEDVIRLKRHSNVHQTNSIEFERCFNNAIDSACAVRKIHEEDVDELSRRTQMNATRIAELEEELRTSITATASSL